MSLTPEDRQRIYEEEKARHEAQDQIKAEKKKSGCLGCLGVIGVIIGILILLALIGTLMTPSSNQSTTTRKPEATTSPDPQRVSDCEGKIAKLTVAGVIQKFDGSRYPLKVYVGSTFHSLTFDQKTAAAKLISDCIAEMGGKSGGAASFDLCDAYSGEALYSWDYIKLKKR